MKGRLFILAVADDLSGPEPVIQLVPHTGGRTMTEELIEAGLMEDNIKY